MCKKSEKKLGLALLIIASLYGEVVNAQVPVTDSQNVKTSIENWFTDIKESKFVVDTTKMAKDTAAAIGTAKESVTEYILKNKEKIEEKLKKLEKYKEKAEEYKKQYDEYKKQLDEAIAMAQEAKAKVEAGIETAKEIKSRVEAGIETAKEIKSRVETGIETAKGAVETAKGVVENAKGVVDAGIENAKGVVDNAKSVVDENLGIEDTNENAEDDVIPQTSRQEFTDPNSPVTTDTDSKTASEIIEASPIENTPIEENKTEDGVTSVPEQIIQDATQPTSEDGVTSSRTSFTTSSLNGSGSISNMSSIGFAFALELPDDCSDVNGTRVFPKSTCMYCGLSSSKSKEEGAVDACLLKINKESSQAQAYSGKDAPKYYRKGKLEMAAMMIAESYRAANKAETFYDNKVAPIAEAPEMTEQDVLSNLLEFNKAVDEQVNDLIQIYSTRLALQSYNNYGKYNFMPEEEEGKNDEE